MKRPCYCAPCLKWNTKRLLLPILLSGFVSLMFLIFMSLTQNNYTWFTRNMDFTENYFQSFKIQSIKSQIFRNSGTSEEEYHQSGKEDPTPLYKYIITERKKCQQDNPFLILLISVQAWQTEARQAIRQTWGNQEFLPGVRVLRLFLLGKEADHNLQQKVAEESHQYHDIIQQDFMDTYNNLTLKTLMGLHWVATYCQQASYVIKTDSDMFVNTEYLVRTLLRPDQPLKKNYFTGYLMRDFSPNRNNESKWYMSPELYPGERYPLFCSGTGYVFSGDLAEKIIKVSANIRLLHLEDVFVGICLDKLGISPVSPPRDTDFNHWKLSYSHCMYNQIVTSHQFEPHELISYWNNLQQNKHECVQ